MNNQIKYREMQNANNSAELDFLPSAFTTVVAFVFMVVCMIMMYMIVVWVVQASWNASISEIFGVKDITMWQAFALIILSSVLLGKSAVSYSSK